VLSTEPEISTTKKHGFLGEKKGREVAFPYATHGAGIFTYNTG
jgi:hypothetical protein